VRWCIAVGALVCNNAFLPAKVVTAPQNFAFSKNTFDFSMEGMFNAVITQTHQILIELSQYMLRRTTIQEQSRLVLQSTTTQHLYGGKEPKCNNSKLHKMSIKTP
jgi:hypothetical protein